MILCIKVITINTERLFQETMNYSQLAINHPHIWAKAIIKAVAQMGSNQELKVNVLLEEMTILKT